MGASRAQHIRWVVHDDGVIELDFRLGRRGGELMQRALDAACAELDRRQGPVAGGSNASTPEAALRRADAFQLLITRAIEVWFSPRVLAQFWSEGPARREDEDE